MAQKIQQSEIEEIQIKKEKFKEQQSKIRGKLKEQTELVKVEKLQAQIKS